MRFRRFSMGMPQGTTPKLVHERALPRSFLERCSEAAVAPSMRASADCKSYIELRRRHGVRPEAIFTRDDSGEVNNSPFRTMSAAIQFRG